MKLEEVQPELEQVEQYLEVVIQESPPITFIPQPRVEMKKKWRKFVKYWGWQSAEVQKR